MDELFDDDDDDILSLLAEEPTSEINSDQVKGDVNDTRDEEDFFPQVSDDEENDKKAKNKSTEILLQKDVSPDVKAHIAALEAELARLKSQQGSTDDFQPTTTSKSSKALSISSAEDQQCKHDQRRDTTSASNRPTKTVGQPSHVPSIGEPRTANTSHRTEANSQTKKPRLAHESKNNKKEEGSKSFYKKDPVKEAPCSAKPLAAVKPPTSLKPVASVKSSTTVKPPTSVKAAVAPGNHYTFSGIRIMTPLVPSSVLESRMDGRRMIAISRIAHKMTVDHEIPGDWVTVGVLASKGPQKTSSTGKTFTVWKLSDLTAGCENESVGCFLFGKIYEEHWKIPVGQVVALLNPSIMKPKEGTQGLSITMDNPKKLMEIGTSLDLGTCRGQRRSDGVACTRFINKEFGEYCEFHVMKAHKKARANRSELQSGGLGADPHTKKVTAKRNRMDGLKKEFAEGEWHYGGQTVSIRDDQAQSKKNIKMNNKPEQKVGLRSIMSSEVKAMADQTMKDMKVKRAQDKEKVLDGGSEEFHGLLELPTVGSRNLVHHLYGNHVEEAKVTDPEEAISAKDLLTQHKREVQRSKMKPVQKPPNNPTDIAAKKRKMSDVDFFDKETNALCSDKAPLVKSVAAPGSLFTNRLKKAPTLGKGLARGGDIEFTSNENWDSYDKHTGEDSESIGQVIGNTGRELIVNRDKTDKHLDLENNEPIAKKQKCSLEQKRAKEKALATIQRKGGIEPLDPNMVGKKKSPKSVNKIEEKLAKDLNKSDSTNSEERSPEEEKKKRKSLLSGVLGSIDLNSKEAKIAMKSHSKNVGAVKLAEMSQQDKYFAGMQKKEAMEKKMTSTDHMKVKCHACRQCKYVAQSQSELCKNEGHVTTQVMAEKRFFACKSCKTRAVSYGGKLPNHGCRKCGENDYERVSMGTERKGPKLGGETLLVRGEERTFLNNDYTPL